MFWGLVVRANKRYSQTVSKTFHLSQATLDVNAATTGNSDVQLRLNADNEDYILCTLSKKNNVLQVPLDLVFSEGDHISFSSNGVVHLTGYLVPNEDFEGFDGMNYGQEDEEEEEEENEDGPAAEKAKALTKAQQKLKKLLQEELADEEDEDDSDFSEASGENAEDEEEDDADDDDDDAEEDDDEDSDDDEEEIAEPVTKKQKQSNGLSNGKAPAPVSKADKKAEKKSAEKQQVKPEQKAAAAAVKTLSGGVKVEEIRTGKGPEAVPGKRVQVYYEGRLKSNNKVFDSAKSGKGFSFDLGRGDVIRAWDIGVAGMKVGSKRRITCPPAVAYGAKGAPPSIPPNATLVFDVELRNVK